MNEGIEYRLPAGDDELYALSFGDGPAVVVLHGGLGLDHTYLVRYLKPLADTHRLIFYDHRGNGRSSPPADWQAVDHGVWADDVNRVADAFGLDTFTVFGHSYGSFLALEHALRHQERLERLIVCSCTPALDYAEEAVARAQARATPEQMEELLGLLSAPVASDEALKAGWAAILPVYFHQYEEYHGEVFDGVRYSAGASNRSTLECLPTYSVEDRLQEIEVAALVLSGAHDWITPPDLAGDRVVAGLPEAEHRVFERSGHFPFIEENAAFVERVEAWLTG